MPKTELPLKGEMILDVSDSCSGIGRNTHVKVVESPVQPHPHTAGYYGIPAELLGIPWFAGLRVRVTVEVIGVNDDDLIDPNPWYRARSEKDDYKLLKEQRGRDEKYVEACRTIAKRVKAQLAEAGTAPPGGPQGRRRANAGGTTRTAKRGPGKRPQDQG
jgi:hypothetical protein